MLSDNNCWQNRTVLITGGSSFVAASLIRRLLALEARVHVLLRHTSSPWRLADCIDSLTVHSGDITDNAYTSGLVQSVNPAVIFHLAAAKGLNTSAQDYVCTSVVGASNLIQAMQAVNPGLRLVVTGSSTEYAPSHLPLKESFVVKPITLLGAVKAAAGLLYSQARAAHGLSITQLRLFHVYGPWESPHRFLPTAINSALQGSPVQLVKGISRRDWIYVEDVVDALLLAYNNNSDHDILNIGSGLEYTNTEILDILQDVLGQEIDSQSEALPSRPTDSEHRFADIALAKSTLGWAPKTSIRQGIADTVEWIRGLPPSLIYSEEAPPTAF